MKRFTLLLLVLFFSVNLFAQDFIGQKGFNFQGIARGTDGNSIVGKSVSVKFSIGDDWSETQQLTTDSYGVFSTTIGSVVATQDGFNKLDFTSYDYNLQVEVNGNIIYNRKFDAVPYAKAAGNGVPVGTIVPYALAVPQAANNASDVIEVAKGWLLCNGAVLSDKKYDILKAKLGGRWGTNVLPDLRGYFLRGVDHGAEVDPNSSERKKGDGTTAGNVVGSYQLDIFKRHNHIDSTYINGPSAKYNWIGFAMNSGASTAGSIDGGNEMNVQSYSKPMLEGGAETRPKNAYVNYIIKY